MAKKSPTSRFGVIACNLVKVALKTANYGCNQKIRRNAKRNRRPPRLLGTVLRSSASRKAEAEVLPVLVNRCNLRGVLRGADWLLARSSLQPQSAGWLCVCRKALYYQTREGLRKASEMPLISRSLASVGVSLAWLSNVPQERNFAAYEVFSDY